MKKITSFLILLVLLFSQTATSAMAQAGTVPPTLNGFGDKIIEIINTIAFPFAGIVGVAFVVRAGYTWMLANGDPQKIAEAQGTITWAIIGLIFLFLIRIIIGIVIDFFGITI